MKKKLKKKHSHRWKALLILAVLIFLALIGINWYAERKIHQMIQGKINNAPGHLYRLTFKSVDVNILTGSLSLTNAEYLPTDSALALFRSDSLKSLARIRAGDVIVRGVNFFRILSRKELDIKKIQGDDIYLDFLSNSRVEKKKTTDHRGILPAGIGKSNIAEVGFRDVNLRLFSENDLDKPFFQLDSLYFSFEKFIIGQPDSTRPLPFYFEKLSIKTGEFKLANSEFYNLSTEDIRYSQQDSMLVIDEFKLIPRYSKNEFNSKIQYNADWFNIQVKKISLKQFDLSSLEIHKMVRFGSIDIEQPDVEIYRDKSLPDAPFKYKPLLTSLIKKIPLPVRIDTVYIRDGKLLYSEKISGHEVAGQVYFDPMFLTAYYISNDSSFVAEHPSFSIDFKGNIMRKTEVTASLIFDYNSPSDAFRIKGQLQPVDASAFNPMLENQLFVRLDDGSIHKVSFHFEADDHRSKGELVLQYDNLKVSVLRENDHERSRAALSFIANNLIRSRNLEGDKKYIVGTIQAERRKDRGLVNFLWKSIKSGIIPIVAPVADKSQKKSEHTESPGHKKHKN